MEEKYLEINGVIADNNNKLSGEEIIDMLLDWLESNNMSFGGGYTTETINN